MSKSYYLDTCIWRDFYEDRYDPNGKPLGRYAAEFILRLLGKGDLIFFSDLTVKELSIGLNRHEIERMFAFLFCTGNLVYVQVMEHEYSESLPEAKRRNIPASDVLHAIIARNHGAVLVTRDNHFKKVRDIAMVKKPEELI